MDFCSPATAIDSIFTKGIKFTNLIPVILYRTEILLVPVDKQDFSDILKAQTTNKYFKPGKEESPMY